MFRKSSSSGYTGTMGTTDIMHPSAGMPTDSANDHTMPATKVSQLLPIPDGIQHPHAYQVFGLEGGEQDPQKVKSAIAATIAQLNSRKEDTDPTLWKQAAKLVKQAKAVLADPVQRRELDARFGIIDLSAPPLSAPPPAEPSPSSVATPSEVLDPLAGLLPSADPLADAPPPIPASIPAPPPPPVSAMKSPVAINSGKPSDRRRSKSNGILGLFTLGLFAIVALLTYFVFFGPGELAITSRDGELRIRTGTSETGQTAAAARNKTPGGKANADPVLPRTPASDPSRSAGKSTDFDDAPRPRIGMPGDPIDPLPPEWQMEMASSPDSPGKPDSPTDSNQPPAPMTPRAPDTVANPDAMMEVVPAGESAAVEMTEAMVQEVDQQIKHVQDLIRQAKWKEMAPAAAELKEALMTDQQRQQVETLYELADLASYYYGAIERGIGSRQAAEMIDVSGSVQIGIVEVGPDLLVIRYAGKNKRYTFRELPLALAHRMAEFALSQDKATNLAAKACYQAIAPMSNVDYRKQAMEWLNSTAGDVAGVHPQRIANTIQELF